MSHDSTFDILDEIELYAGELERVIDRNNDSLVDIDESLDSLLVDMTDANSSIGQRHASFENLNEQIAQRINDFEIAITEKRATQLFTKNNLEPIFFQGDGISFSITPQDRSRIRLTRRVGRFNYSAKMLINMIVSISNQNDSLITMILSVRFLLDDDNLKPTIILSPRFIKENTPHNPFSKLPVKYQADVLNRVRTEIEQTFTNNFMKFDPFDFGGVQINSTPSTFIISRGYLIFFSKILPKRKSPEPIISNINSGYTQAIKIKDKIIEKEIRRKIEGKASLNSIKFKNGFIRISTSRSDSKSILHISVKTWARIDYRLYFTVSNLINLSLDAKWAEWEYKIKAKRCWPICNDVISVAKRIVEKEINKNLYFTEYVESFSSKATHIRTRVTSYGLQIEMRAR